MDLKSVHGGDIVECDVRGRRFFALVTSKPETIGRLRNLSVRPITSGITHRTVTSLQVVGHYRRSKASARAREEAV